tara:strand:- start:295 stop:405 length:111 start_codon:yes stop_codon:yes gene_type:complete
MKKVAIQLSENSKVSIMKVENKEKIVSLLGRSVGDD